MPKVVPFSLADCYRNNYNYILHRLYRAASYYISAFFPCRIHRLAFARCLFASHSILYRDTERFGGGFLELSTSIGDLRCFSLRRNRVLSFY